MALMDGRKVLPGNGNYGQFTIAMIVLYSSCTNSGLLELNYYKKHTNTLSKQCFYLMFKTNKK